MAWLSSADVYRDDLVSSERVYQFAVADDDFLAKYPAEGGEGIAAGYRAAGITSGDSVVRYYKRKIIRRTWPGLTQQAANTLMNTLIEDDEYNNVVAERNDAGGYNVSGDRFLRHTDGWTLWFKQDQDGGEIGMEG